MFLGLMLAALIASTFAREHAFDPRLWGESGVLVSDHAEGQYCPTVATAGELTVAAWQDDRGVDPDIAIAVLGADGEVVRERVFTRAGVQTRPVIAGRWLVFVESANGADWSVVGLRLADLDRGTDSLVVIADTPGAKPEVVAEVTAHGELIVAWIADSDTGGRALRGAIIGQNDRSPVRFPIVNTFGTVMDLHMAVNHDLVFFAWTDWSGVEPTITSQCVDLEHRLRTFGPAGLVLTRGYWAWYPHVVPSDQGYGAFTWVERQPSGEARVVYQIVDYQSNFRFWNPIGVTDWSLDMTETDTAPFMEGGVIVAAAERDFGSDRLTAHALDFNGARVWETLVSDLGFRVRDARAVSNGLTSWITWRDERFGASTTFAARLDASGNNTWQPMGTAVARTGGNQWSPAPHLAATNHLIVSWTDEREVETPRIGLQKMK
ncbi:MAG: hypothetical protein HYV34_01525 [Candidatus Kerfeldbacteria bacterium]|nr:hypothetical protein [Candidatus Kerfeldbacteria bacterium]